MKQLIDFIPLIFFFIAYKLWGVQEAAIILVAGTVIQLLLLKFLVKKIDKAQWITAGLVIFFGILTAYFNDLRYLQWKVTIVNALFAIALLVSQFVFRKPLVKLLLGKELSLPEAVWSKLNLGWAGFFVLCMLINIVVSQAFSEEVWATFKVFGLTGLSLVAVILTAIYLYPHLKNHKEQQ